MLKYKTSTGHIYEINRILDFPIYSKKVMPTAIAVAPSTNQTKFFDETGGQNANSNIDTPGQFSNTQTYVLHSLQTDFGIVNNQPVNDSDLVKISEVINSSFMRIVKNKDTVWECTLLKMHILDVVFDGAIGLTTNFDKVLRGSYTFNEPIIFRPGEKFDFTMNTSNTQDVNAVNLLFTMLGFLGIEQEVMTSG